MIVTFGFPAHAGMDPLAKAKRPVRMRFPRPRGDGPFQASGSVGTTMVSPPTRGWTRWKCCGRLASVGFPAHAGMDQVAQKTVVVHDRFPRPRGDGPVLFGYPFRLREVSPPTRGWTRLWLGAGVRCGGFPAHAGMDPWTLTGDRACHWFPRPRGDGPGTRIIVMAAPPVSPPTRGWTEILLVVDRMATGFPAHAGMDPSTCHVCPA